MIKIICEEPDEMLKLACKVLEEKLNKWADLKQETQHGTLEVAFYPNDVIATLKPSYHTKMSRDVLRRSSV